MMESMMETMTGFIALCFGLLLRLVLPIAVTLVAVHFLRKLDAHWQTQAEAELEAHAAQVKPPECWKIKDCLPEQRQACPAFITKDFCWQVYRLSNGYLADKCLTCKVFLNAPIPEVLVHE